MHGVDDDPSGDWNRVSQSADHVLSTAHNAIDALSDHGENKGNTASFARHSNVSAPPDTEISDEGNSDLCGVFENITQKAAEELNGLGFSGSVNIDPTGLPSSVDPAARDEAIRLVREICANVRRHGSKDGDWSLAIRGENIRSKNLSRQADSGREIRGRASEQLDGNVQHAADRVGTGFSGQTLVIVGMNTIDDDHPVIGPSGRGLQLHRQTLARLGGTLTTSSDDGIWTIRAVIPVQSLSAHDLDQ